MGGFLVDAHFYQHMVRKLNFLLQYWLDIGFVVNNVNWFCTHPQKPHLDVVKHIYRYVKGAIDMGLFYWQGEDCVLSKFSNANWAGDRDDKISTIGYIFLLGSTPIMWHSHKQLCVVVSSTENEYMALSSCVREGVWLWRLLIELNLIKSTKPMIISCNNQSVIKLSDNPIFHARTKHIEVHHHYIWKPIQNGVMKITHVLSQDQIADIFTKPLGVHYFASITMSLDLYTPMISIV
jgi:hypothetical protein